MLTRPYVGLRPTVPVRPAGMRIDPPVSEPIEPRAADNATETAEPPLEPPAIRSGSHGLRTAP